ncbi:MAG: GlsB/YeaQ/YmgE family stress response membrane protein [Mycobacterium sp.]|nr:GlsB/YeaQ/YmgE family stress response membrane protein [Mycobacterium sp.]
MNVMAATDFVARLELNGKTGIGWIGYIIIGGIAGWLASKLVKGGGSGILMDIVIGVVGAFVAGLVLNLLGVDVKSGGYWFTFFVALGGAVVLLWIVRLVRRT